MAAKRRTGRAARAVTGAAAVTTILMLAFAPQPASAQFFWDQPRFSPDDAARVAIRRGFRVIARPILNDNVYVTEVVDMRGAREQLIIAADTGRIIQRYYVDMGRERPYADPSIPPGPMPPGRVPDSDRQPSLFSRLFGGGDDNAAPDRPQIAPDAPIRPAPRVRRPRLVEQETETVRAPSPVESSPLAPPTTLPSAVPSLPRKPATIKRAPAEASLPSPAATPAPAPAVTSVPPAGPDRPVRSISSNPLAIPGSREQDEHGPAVARKTTPAASAVPVVKPPEPAPPAKDAVPVAPLE